MKILWTTNILLLEPRNRIFNNNFITSGTWLDTLFNSLKFKIKEEEYSFFVITSSSKVSETKYFISNNITYIVVPRKREYLFFRYKATLKNINKIIEDINPDIIHIHGTEDFYGLVNPNNAIKVFSIQGVMQQISKFTVPSLINPLKVHVPKLRDFYNSLYQKRIREREFTIINANKYFIGRTDFDKYHIKIINKNAKYFGEFYDILRDLFYEKKWNFDSSKENLIHTTLSFNKSKGIYFLLEVAIKVKKHIPHVIFNISGDDSVKEAFLFKNKIKKYGLNDNFNFLGICDEYTMVESMLSSRLFFLPSFIENSPLSLIEAQSIGMPCIAACTGGIQSFINDYSTGFLYPLFDSDYASGIIITHFQNKSLLSKISIQSREQILIKCNRDKITEKYINLYNTLIAYKNKH